jgi:hypothetical protein
MRRWPVWFDRTSVVLLVMAAACAAVCVFVPELLITWVPKPDEKPPLWVALLVIAAILVVYLTVLFVPYGFSLVAVWKCREAGMPKAVAWLASPRSSSPTS